MQHVQTPQALKVKDELEKRTGYEVLIYKNVPDPLFKRGYFARCITESGEPIEDKYGTLYRKSKSLTGLLG